MRDDLIAVSVLAMATVPGVLSTFEPSPFTMQTFAYDPELRKLIRREYFVGGGVALAIAGAAARLAHSWIPFLGAVGVLGVTIWEYERALRRGRTSGKDMTKPVHQAGPADPDTRGTGRGSRAGRYTFAG